MLPLRATPSFSWLRAPLLVTLVSLSVYGFLFPLSAKCLVCFDDKKRSDEKEGCGSAGQPMRVITALKSI